MTREDHRIVYATAGNLSGEVERRWAEGCAGAKRNRFVGVENGTPREGRNRLKASSRGVPDNVREQQRRCCPGVPYAIGLCGGEAGRLRAEAEFRLKAGAVVDFTFS